MQKFKSITEVNNFLTDETKSWLVDKIELSAEKETPIAETKANEVMHTTNTWFWQELIAETVQHSDPIMSLAKNYSTILPMFSAWFRAEWMGQSVKVAVIWDAWISAPRSEITTWGIYWAPQGQDKFATWRITINQGQFIKTITISLAEQNYALTWNRNVADIAREKLTKSIWRTLDYMLFNADTATSWNVNLDWWTPSLDTYLEFDWGLRKRAIADWNVVDCWTLTEKDFSDVLDLIEDDSDAVFFLPKNVYWLVRNFDSYKSLDKAWEVSTLRTWVVWSIFWVPVVKVADAVVYPQLALATWKVSSTPASNTLSSFVCARLSSFVHWYWMPVQLWAQDRIWIWTEVVWAYDFGWTTASDIAWVWKTVAMWVNVTV